MNRSFILTIAMMITTGALLSAFTLDVNASAEVLHLTMALDNEDSREMYTPVAVPVNMKTLALFEATEGIIVKKERVKILQKVNSDRAQALASFAPPVIEIEEEEKEIEPEVEKVITNDLPIITKQGDYRDVNWNSQTAYTAEELDKYLKRGLSGLGSTYKKVESETGVNALLLIAISAGESTHGTSKIARVKNNLFGYGAYNSNPFESAITFSSYEDCISTVAQAIKTNYLTPGGKYYNGPTLKGMNVKYCTGNNWTTLMNDMVKSIDYHANK